MADRDSQLPWNALTFVLAAGGVALLFVGIGWWLAQRRAQQGAVGALSGASWEAPSFPPATPVNLLASRDSRSKGRSMRLEVEQQARIERRVVSTTAIEIIAPTRAGARRIRIAADQPIRVGDGSSLTTDPAAGLPITAGDQPFDFGVVPGSQRLFAVVAPGGSTANVTVLSQIVEG